MEESSEEDTLRSNHNQSLEVGDTTARALKEVEQNLRWNQSSPGITGWKEEIVSNRVPPVLFLVLLVLQGGFPFNSKSLFLFLISQLFILKHNMKYRCSSVPMVLLYRILARQCR